MTVAVVLACLACMICSVCGSCKTSQIIIPDDNKAPIMLTPTLSNSNCIWLIQAPNNTRIRLDPIEFITNGNEFLEIGHGNNASDVDSMITKLEGASTYLSMITSGTFMWMKYFGDVKIRGKANMSITFGLEDTPDCLKTCWCLKTIRVSNIKCISGWDGGIIGLIPLDVSHLYLAGGKMSSLDERTFSRLPNLKSLSLLRNEISNIKNNTFGGLHHLKIMNLSGNIISDIEIGGFNGLDKLTWLDLRVNNISQIQPDRFSVLPKLQKLYLHNNYVESIPAGFCKYLRIWNPLSLRLDGNKVKEILPGTFTGCYMIATLKLSRNSIARLTNGSFQGLPYTVSLELSKNNIKTVDKGAFTGLKNLIILRLKSNRIETLMSSAFDGLHNLTMLDLRYNPWKNIEQYAISGMPNLQYLFLERLINDQHTGTLHLKSLDGLVKLQEMLVDDHRLCCFHPDACKPQTKKPLFHTCDRLMPNNALRALLWIFGISAMAGNIYVIVLRCQEKNVRNQTQAILIVNLAISDLLMGFYMLIIAGADVHFGDNFFLSAEVWKSSGACMFAGFISLFSSEASVFFVVLISLDRLLCVALPFGKKRMTPDLAKIICTLIWISVTVIGIIAIVLQLANTEAYDVANVCVGIPLVSTKNTFLQEVKQSVDHVEEALVMVEVITKDTASMWQFSIAIYLGLNFVAFLVVVICYVTIAIIVAVKLPSKQLQQRKDRSREMQMAGKMALIVFTDLCCWIPVIILCILIQSGAVEAVPIVTYAWLVALVLPLNAALNPYIYTISNEITKLKRHRREKKQEMNMRKTAGQSQTMNTCNTKTSRFTNL